MDIKGTLTKKIGPLPAIGWAAVAGGIFIALAYARAKKNATTTAPGAVTQAQPDLGTSTDFSNGYTDAADSSGGGVTTSTTQTYTPPAIATNLTWGQRALNYLIGNGANPSDASTAIGSYLYSTGQTLNSTQGALLNSAITQFGAPPEGVILPPPVATPGDSTPTTTTSDPTQGESQYGKVYQQYVTASPAERDLIANNLGTTRGDLEGAFINNGLGPVQGHV